MNTIEEIKNKIAMTENLSIIFEKTFANCYSCGRVWSAWGYNTMSHDDFFHFEQGDEAYEEAFAHFKRRINLTDCSNFDDFIDLIEKVIAPYTLLYNSDIESKFDSCYFDEDILSHISLNDLHIAVISYQKANALNILI